MKKLTVAVAVLATAVGLSACGSADKTATGSSSGSSAPSSSSSTVAAGAKAGDTVDVGDVMSRSVEALREKKTGHMSMAMGALGTVEADVDYGSKGSTALSMRMDLAGQKMEVILLDKVFYLGGDMFAPLTGGKKWVKADPNGTDPLSKQLAPVFEQLDSLAANPAQQFAGMKGVKATVYKADSSGTTYDVKLTQEQLAAMEKDALPGGVDAGTIKNLPDGIEYSITLDREQLPVLLETQVEGKSVKVTMSNWGEPVKIEAPPASEFGMFKMSG